MSNVIDVTKDTFRSEVIDSDKLVVDRMYIRYDRSTNLVKFDLAGTSKSEQRVRAVLTMEAYGREVYRKEFNPCDEGIDQLCPGTSNFTLRR